MIDRLRNLQEVGLSRNRAKVYLTLLENGSLTAERIARNSGIHRRNVYDTVQSLMKMGLVSYVMKNKVKFFKATDPYYLLELLETEKNKLRKKEDKIASIITDFLQIQKTPKEENFVSIYKGTNGIKFVFNDILKTKKENLVLSAHRPSLKIKSYLEIFHKRRIKLGIREKLLFNRGDKERASKLNQFPYTKVKFMPRNSKKQTAINIYGDKVAIIMWPEPFAIIIENKEIAESFRSYFKILWNLS